MWHEFKIGYSCEVKEPLTAVLYDLGCQGIAEEEGRLSAYFPETVSPEKVVEALAGFTGVTVEHGPIEEQDWYAPWKERFRPFKTAGLTICPPWVDYKPGPDERLLVLDPGQAFGTGDHVTTMTVLRMLRSWAESQGDLAEKRFLDLGTGTGILSIAAFLYGLRDITAVDIEASAVETARRNFGLNGVTGKVRLIQGGVKEAGGSYDLIAANIFLDTLIEVIPEAARALKRGGGLIVSGLLSGQEEKLIPAAEAACLDLVEIITEGGWVSAYFRR